MAGRILKDNQAIQKEQQADYQHLADYLKEAESSSAKFWVACNQTMQKYVEAAAQGMDKITASGKRNAELAQANQQVVAEFDARLQEFMNYQKLSICSSCPGISQTNLNTRCFPSLFHRAS